jgi:uncharacterized protein YjbI with pentapeptide repeats
LGRTLRDGVDGWNNWRRPDQYSTPVDLSHANLSDHRLAGIDLFAANLVGADLSGADLINSNLAEADLAESRIVNATLTGAQMRRTRLRGADLSGSILNDVHLRRGSLSAATFRGATLLNANLSNSSMYKTDFSGANMQRISTTYSNLTEASLKDADLREAHLEACSLNGAGLVNADLRFAAFTGSDLSDANLRDAFLYETVFADAAMVNTRGLDNCRHNGPSVIDHRTLQKSGALPLAFLRGVGLSDNLIGYLPSLLNQAVQFYSCFISYSTKDQEFADRLYADLQNQGVRCWFAPHDLPIGGKILDEIDAAIRLRDKVVLILSEHSINSDWVEDEVTAAFEEERKRGQIVLFPVRLDDSVMNTNEAWAAKLRARNIGDLRKWKDHDAYKQSFERVLRDLTKPQEPK